MKMMDTRMKLILMNDKENSSFVTSSIINIACHAPHREYYLQLLLDPFGRYRYPELMSGMKLRNDNILNPYLSCFR